jgi:hypothetical protein
MASNNPALGNKRVKLKPIDITVIDIDSGSDGELPANPRVKVKQEVQESKPKAVFTYGGYVDDEDSQELPGIEFVGKGPMKVHTKSIDVPDHYLSLVFSGQCQN